MFEVKYALIFGEYYDCRAHVRLFLGCAYYRGALIYGCIQYLNVQKSYTLWEPCL